ncbi:MAG: TfoX/Sxy family protein [Oscillospiraceae bacterium]|nr:TfoX/Sxy family protein [Oscillospiraceae bacterium]
MPSTKSYLDFILEQLPPEVTCRAMMGEYVLYYHGKVFGGIYDDRLLVKIVPAALERLGTAARELPYPGAKEMLLVEDLEDREFLRDLLEAMDTELPSPRRR